MVAQKVWFGLLGRGRSPKLSFILKDTLKDKSSNNNTNTAQWLQHSQA